MGKVVTREWRKAKVLNWNLHLFQLLEIIQVLVSISWVRCASGNVFITLFQQIAPVYRRVLVENRPSNAVFL